MDNTKLTRSMLTLVLVVLTVGIASYGLRANQAVIYWMVVAFPVIVYLVKDPRSLFILAVMANLAWLKTPGTASDVLRPLNLASVALFFSSFAMIAMNKLSKPRRISVDHWLFGFFIVVLLTIAVRGGGLSILGSKSWGGGKYINLTLVFCLYYAMRRFEYNRSHVRWLIWGGIFFTGVLSFGQWLFSYTGGQSYGMTTFMDIQAKSAAGAELMGDARAITRFTHFRWLAFALLPLCFFWPKRKLLSVSIIIFSAYLMLLTGFRIEVVSVGMVYLGSGFVLAKDKGRFVIVHALAGITGYIGLVLISSYLPEAAIRSISFLPGIEVPDIIMTGAEDSASWRFELWTRCLKEIPNYLFIGRGITFEVMEWAWLNASVYSSPEFFYATHAYHNGPLALLLDFGIFGFLTMTGFFFSSVAYLVRSIRSVGDKDSIYYKFAMYTVVLYIWMVVKFYLIYGDLTHYFPRTMVLYTMALASLSYLKRSPPYAFRHEESV